MSQTRPFHIVGGICTMVSRNGRAFSVISSFFGFAALFLEGLLFETCGVTLTASTSTSRRAPGSTRAEGRPPSFERSATGPNRRYNGFLDNTYVAPGYSTATVRVQKSRRPFRHSATAMAGMRVGLFSLVLWHLL